MRSFLIIAGYNFRDIIGKRFFKISTFIITVFIVLVCILPDLVIRFGLLEKNKEYLFYIVDNENHIFDNHLDLNLYANNSSDSLDGEYFFHLVEDDVAIEDIKAELNKGIINGYLVVKGENRIDIFTNGNDYSDLKFILDRYISIGRLSGANINYEDIYVDYEQSSSVTSEVKFKNILRDYMVPSILSIFAYIIFVMYGQVLGINVNIEKNSKITEIFLTKAKPLNIILGKVFGVLLACMIQLIYFLSVLFLTVGFLNRDFQFIKSLVEFDIIFIIRYLVYFALGFVFYGLIFMAIGSLVSKTEDLSIGLIPVTFLISIGCAVTFLLVQFPQNNLINALKYIPFFTTFSITAGSLLFSFDDIIVIVCMIVYILLLVALNINVVRSVIRFRGNNFQRKRN